MTQIGEASNTIFKRKVLKYAKDAKRNKIFCALNDDLLPTLPKHAKRPFGIVQRKPIVA